MLLFLPILLLLSITAFSQEQISAEKFDQIASAPGDKTPLSGKLAVFPFWTNSEANIFLKYEDGRTFKEDDVVTAKTINGKYIVFTMQSQFYKQPMNSIVTYDEKKLAFKVWGKYGETVTEGITVLDSKKKTYKTSSSYGDGFTEAGSGSYSDKGDSGRTLVYKNGTLVMTREVKSTPLDKLK
jgi:hypothetical protein